MFKYYFNQNFNQKMLYIFIFLYFYIFIFLYFYIFIFLKI
jgi:hypothetical protein